MSIPEIRHRVVEAARDQLLRVEFGRSPQKPQSDESGRPWVAQLPTGFDTKRYLDAAESVLAGRFNCFSLGNCYLGLPPDWNRDPKSGVRAPLGVGRLLDYRNEALVGNIKYLWEPNRHLELVTLAQAWHLSGDAKYLHGIRTLLTSWFDQCPYPQGPNWCSSLELAIRLVNWSFVWTLVGGETGLLFAGKSGQGLRERWLDSVYQHCVFISRYPSCHSSANNHRLGELFGLFVASVTWPKWRAAGVWQSSSHEQLLIEVLKQNTSDGVNREQATWYHHEVADMMLIAGVVGRANSIEFPIDYWKRFEAMLEFVAGIMHFGGVVPAFGDSDDAVMVRLSQDPTESVFRSLLATGAVLFGRSDFKAKAGKFDDKSRWLLGDDAARRFDELQVNANRRPPRHSFPDGGYFVLGSDIDTAKEVRIVADAGPLGYLSIAAHGHADALSFTLSAAGREMLVDPGTYSYHTDLKWRDYFRGTAAHNTIRIDGVDQSVSGGRFMWIRHAQVSCEHVDLSGSPQVLVASHGGYLRLADPVRHRRKLIYWPETRILRVEDEILSEAVHEFEIAWHFAEDCKVSLLEGGALVQAEGVELQLSWPPETHARCVCGGTNPPRGWISRRFDAMVACPTVVVSGRNIGHWRGVTELRVNLLCDVRNAR